MNAQGAGQQEQWVISPQTIHIQAGASTKITIRSLNPERGFEWTVDRPLLDSRRFHFTPDRDGYVLGGQEDTVNVSMTPRTFNRAGDGPTHVTLVIGLEEQPVEVRVFYLPQSLAATPPPSPESDSE